MTGRIPLLVISALALATAACEDGSSNTATEETSATITDTPGSYAAGDGAPATDWEFAASVSGALRQIVVWSDGFAALHFPDGDDWSRDVARPRVMYSSNGVDWEAAPDPPEFEFVYALAGHDGDLFALTGDTRDLVTPQTLWYRSSGSPWREVLSHESLESLAIGADRVIAYRHSPFEVLAVHDAATLEPVEFAGIPDLERPDEVPGPGEIREFPSGGVIGLDEGFLARVGWADTSFSDGDRVAWLMYSADGSTWIEHPSDSSTAIDVSHRAGIAPTFDGLNLLTTDRRRPNTAGTRLVRDRWDHRPSNTGDSELTTSWVTDTGIDLRTTAPATIDTAWGTARGFFDVTDGAVRHSLDGLSWELVGAPPTWSVVADLGKRGLAEATIVDSVDGLIAFGVHGSLEWGVVAPTTEIWISP